jgi:hypothetical protein
MEELMTEATAKLEALLKTTEEAAQAYLPFESILQGYHYIKEALDELEETGLDEPVTTAYYDLLLGKTHLIACMAILLMFDLMAKRREAPTAPHHWHQTRKPMSGEYAYWCDGCDTWVDLGKPLPKAPCPRPVAPNRFKN